MTQQLMLKKGLQVQFCPETFVAALFTWDTRAIKWGMEKFWCMQCVYKSLFKAIQRDKYQVML